MASPIEKMPTANPCQDDTTKQDHELSKQPWRSPEWLTFAVLFANLLAFGYYTHVVVQQRDAMVASNSNTSAFFQNSERAWVGADTIEAHFDVGQPPSVHLVYTNSGKTPARNLRSAIAIRDFPPSKECQAPLVAIPEKGSSASVLLPGARGQAGKKWATSLTPENLEAIRAGIIQMCIHAILAYDDIFDRPHITTICEWLLPDGRVVACDKGNDIN
jgi:hypothetical protein